MIAIINGKIVNAWKANPNIWLFRLKQYLNSFGLPPVYWEIFGGNTFLLKVIPAQDALWAAICIKAIFRQLPPLDIDLYISLGTEDQSPASLQAGRGLVYTQINEQLKAPAAAPPGIRISAPDPSFARQLNLMLTFAGVQMNSWSVAEAEIVELNIVFPEKSQQEIAGWLQIKQSAVSQRLKRAHFDLLLQLNEHYKTELSRLS